MPAGQLYINGSDAYTTWGISLENSSGLSALIAPAPLKDMVENASAIENGKRVVRTDRPQDERTVTLNIHLVAPDETTFWSKYASFCSELAGGAVNIKTSFQSTIEYHFDYLSCSQFSEWQRGIAKFTLRLVEPNPASRTPINYSTHDKYGNALTGVA